MERGTPTKLTWRCDRCGERQAGAADDPCRLCGLRFCASCQADHQHEAKPEASARATRKAIAVALALVREMALADAKAVTIEKAKRWQATAASAWWAM